MSSPFIGEILMFGGTFNPRNWAFCNGQLLPISQNQALFSILGTTYGGDGRVTFALPDMRGRVSVHPGTGPGLSPRRLGDKGGTETNTLNVTNLPSHNHSVAPKCTSAAGGTDTPVNNFPSAASEDIYNSTAGTNQFMGATNTSNTGGGQAVNNMQPFLCVNYLIALFGVFPSRN